jgi:hypothetical protein
MPSMNHTERPDEALARIQRERREAAQDAAAEPEYQSWLYRLNARAIAYCPNTDRMHAEKPADPLTGYAYVCTRCGHHSIFPF